MLTNEFKEITLSRLGFGTMRLPVIGGNAAEIDEKLVDEMVDYAISHGINYFDTAYPYHGRMSEKVVGRSLSRYPRESYYLATKYPGHQLSSSYDPAAIFEEQLKKCGVDCFDFYLLHNVYENSIQVYTDERWGIVDYFVEQKRKGRIKHLGFSCHGRVDTLRAFLDYCGDKMEFCQIQLNYLDWTLQDAKEKYELLTERGLGVWVMEPVRGGRLAKLSEAETSRLRELRSDESSAAWAFRFLQGLPNVKMILSGMSDTAQMVENVETFRQEKPLTDTERTALLDIAEGMKNSIAKFTQNTSTPDVPITPAPTYPTGGNTGGTSSSATYSITILTPTNGKITASPTSAQRGDTVTLTASPGPGYELVSLTVTDSRGNKLELTDKGGGKYTFTMPASKVTVDAVFQTVPVPEEPQVPWVTPFTDVAEGTWYYDAVKYVSEKELMNGTGSSLFSPDATTTRAMIWTILARLNGVDTSGSNPWYKRGQDWATANQISDGTAPDASITREQLITMLWRYKGSPNTTADVSRFADSGAASEWAKDAIEWAVSTDLLQGSGGKLDPTGTATRAQVATILQRYCETLA